MAHPYSPNGSGYVPGNPTNSKIYQKLAKAVAAHNRLRNEPSRKNLTIKKLRNEGIRNETDENVSKIIALEDSISIANVFLTRKNLSKNDRLFREGERNRFIAELQKIKDRLKEEEARPISRGSWGLSHTTNESNANYITGTAVTRKGGARRTRKHRGRKMRKTRHTRR